MTMLLLKHYGLRKPRLIEAVCIKNESQPSIASSIKANIKRNNYVKLGVFCLV